MKSPARMLVVLGFCLLLVHQNQATWLPLTLETLLLPKMQRRVTAIKPICRAEEDPCMFLIFDAVTGQTVSKLKSWCRCASDHECASPSREKRQTSYNHVCVPRDDSEMSEKLSLKRIGFDPFWVASAQRETFELVTPAWGSDGRRVLPFSLCLTLLLPLVILGHRLTEVYVHTSVVY